MSNYTDYCKINTAGSSIVISVNDPQSDPVLLYDFLITATLALLFLSTKMQSMIVSSAIVILAAMIGFTKIGALIPPYFMVSLAGDYFYSFPGFGFPRIFSIIILIRVLLHTFYNKTLSIKWWKFYIPVAAATVISFYLAYVNSFINLSTILLNLAVFYSMANMPLNNKTLNYAFTRTYSTVLVFVLLFTCTLIFIPTYYHRGGLNMVSFSQKLNPNEAAQIIAQMGAFCLGFLFLSGRRSLKGLCILGFLLCIYCNLKIGSRAGSIGIIMGSFTAAFIYLKSKGILGKKFISIILLAISFAVIYILVTYTNPYLADRLTINSLIESGGSSRWIYIQKELQYIIPQNLFFGVGIGTNNEVAALSVYFKHAPLPATNLIIGLLTQLGLVGVITYFAFFIKMFCELRKYLSDCKWLVIPLFLMMTSLFNGLGEVVFHERYFWNSFSLIALCIASIYKEKAESRHAF